MYYCVVLLVAIIVLSGLMWFVVVTALCVHLGLHSSIILPCEVVAQRDVALPGAGGRPSHRHRQLRIRVQPEAKDRSAGARCVGGVGWRERWSRSVGRGRWE